MTLILSPKLLDAARSFLEERGSFGLEGTAMIAGPAQLRLVIPDQHARPASASAGPNPAGPTSWGESVCAVVVAKDGARPTAAELIDHVRSVIARYKAPRYVVFVDDLPRLPTGKTDKKLLRSHHSGVGA